ncbi:hypothetical protein PGIN_3A1_00258 [Porphyromonas gingivalis]|nr:hypothetical protein PGIN_3A1_00258 [Porphyromonas gingivalis]
MEVLLFMEVGMKKKNYLKHQEGINLHEDLILYGKMQTGKCIGVMLVKQMLLENLLNEKYWQCKT